MLLRPCPSNRFVSLVTAVTTTRGVGWSLTLCGSYRGLTAGPPRGATRSPGGEWSCGAPLSPSEEPFASLLLPRSTCAMKLSPASAAAAGARGGRGLVTPARKLGGAGTSPEHAEDSSKSAMEATAPPPAPVPPVPLSGAAAGAGVLPLVPSAAAASDSANDGAADELDAMMGDARGDCFRRRCRF